MTRPYPYQIRGTKRIERFLGRAILGDDMGLGKTLQILMFMKRNPQVMPTVVVCPKTIKYVWEQEALDHIGMQAEVVESTKVPEITDLTFYQHQLVVINYDILHVWLPFLELLKPGLVVFDECHYLRSRSTRRTKAAKRLSLAVPRVIGVSGTAFTSRPVELWPVLNMVRPDLYPNFGQFAFRYCKPKRTFWGWQYKGATRVRELHEKLKDTLLIRRRKADVLTELPPKARHILPLEISDRREYELAKKDFIKWISGRHPKKVKKAERAEALMRIGYLKRLAGVLKLPAVMLWVDSFLESFNKEKLIVFAVHQKVILPLQERYGRSCVVVDGSVTGRRRQNAIATFRNDPKCRVFLGNIQAAGVGWSAPGVTNVAFAELAWTPGEHTQAEDRTHGIGRGRAGTPSSSWYLVGKGTIEEDIAKLLKEKQKAFDAVLDGKGEGMGESVFGDLVNAFSGRKETK